MTPDGLAALLLALGAVMLLGGLGALDTTRELGPAERTGTGFVYAGMALLLLGLLATIAAAILAATP